MVEGQWSAPGAREFSPVHQVRLLEPVCLLGESARWDMTARELVWVDLLRGVVHRAPWHDDRFGEVHSERVGDVAAFACPIASGGQVLALRSQVIWTSSPDASKAIEVPIPTGHRFNDGALDRSGRLVVGSMPEDGSPGLGQLWSVSPAEAPRSLLGGLNLPNGIAFSHAGDRMFVIDSIPGLLHEFEYDLQSGDLGRQVSQWAVAEDEALPDGMALDQAGYLWIAMWDGGCVVRFDPRTGEIVDRVVIPARRPTSVALGEADRTLFITTATYGLKTSPADLDGAVFAHALDPRT